MTYVERYSQVRRITARSVLKSVALTFLSTSYRATGRFATFLRKDRFQFLYFHHVFEDETEPFRSLLEQLAKHHTFISYSEAVDRVLSGNIDGSYLTISFDDGLKNCMVAAEIME